MRKIYAVSVLIPVLFVNIFSNLCAAEYTDGRIKLVIDEKLGRFSLYYMTDVERRLYEPLFWEKDKRTSFLSAYIDNKEYKMGNNSEFKMVVRGEKNKPSLVFESRFLSITEEFSFIRTASSGVSNGVRIDIRVESWSPQTINVGVRLLIDTFLGEKYIPPFRTDLRTIGSETIIDKTSPDQYWISRNDAYGLMGSIFVEGTESQDFIQFASWKRMNASKFKMEYVQGRSFNSTPFSVKDSAACYFLDTKPMQRWGQRMMTVLLAAEDNYGFDGDKMPERSYQREYQQSVIATESYGAYDAPYDTATGRMQYGNASGLNTASPGGMPVRPIQTAQTSQAAQPVQPAETAKKDRGLVPLGAMRVDVMTLRELIYKVDEYIYSGIMPSEEELKGMEATAAKLKARYGSVFSTF
ncbi:MAG: hypothetical protein LBD86_06745 [Spirochaetaceae bacterium]|jgi:hypothetical protein|nr:hypothetical protein [Spirochaetaceae bacterium]